jgi:hypothetical protein
MWTSQNMLPTSEAAASMELSWSRYLEIKCVKNKPQRVRTRESMDNEKVENEVSVVERVQIT